MSTPVNDSTAPHFDRTTMITGLREGLAQPIRALERMVDASRDEATSAESKAENKYDTRATEASYLAAGQGRRLADLRQLAAWVETLSDTAPHRVALGSVVHVRFEDDTERHLLLAPQGGIEIDVDRPDGPLRIGLVGVTSPMGRALLGAMADDAVEVPAPAGDREVEVLALY